MERYHTRDSTVWLDTLIHGNLIDSLYGSTSTGTRASPMTDVNTNKALLDRVRDMFYSKFRKLERQLKVFQSNFELCDAISDATSIKIILSSIQPDARNVGIIIRHLDRTACSSRLRPVRVSNFPLLLSGNKNRYRNSVRIIQGQTVKQQSLLNNLRTEKHKIIDPSNT